MSWDLPMAVRIEVALLVVFLASVCERVSSEGVSGSETGRDKTYSRDALPKTVEIPKIRMAGW